MLSRSSRRLHLSALGRRSFFDYVRVANQVDSGKSIAQIEEEFSAEDTTKAADSFGWQWLSWFQENPPEKFAEYSSVRSQFQRWEQYLGGRDVKSSKQIDFGEYRDRIADTEFVDNLEVDFHVEQDTISSISDMSTLDQWSPAAVQSFQTECEGNGDLLVRPLTAEDKQRQKESLENAELYDEKMKVMAAEMLKDFEQVDAERNMLGHETLMMDLAQHPQYAETLEDIYTAKQTYLDYVMMPMHNDYAKKERLRQIQDGERRKAFLERWDRSSKMYNGAESECWY